MGLGWIANYLFGFPAQLPLEPVSPPSPPTSADSSAGSERVTRKCQIRGARSRAFQIVDIASSQLRLFARVCSCPPAPLNARERKSQFATERAVSFRGPLARYHILSSEALQPLECDCSNVKKSTAAFNIRGWRMSRSVGPVSRGPGKPGPSLSRNKLEGMLRPSRMGQAAARGEPRRVAFPCSWY